MHYKTLHRDGSKLESTTNPAEFIALSYTKQQIVWDHSLCLKRFGLDMRWEVLNGNFFCFQGEAMIKVRLKLNFSMKLCRSVVFIWSEIGLILSLFEKYWGL